MVDLLYISSLGAFIHALLSRAYFCVSYRLSVMPRFTYVACPTQAAVFSL